jgi:hypothetical protein
VGYWHPFACGLSLKHPGKTVHNGNLPDQRNSQLIKHHFIDIAPAPLFIRLEGLDDRVRGRMKVFRGMFVWRRVATADVPAGHAKAQVYPGGADTQAVFTAVGTGGYFLNLIEMCAFHCVVS